MDPVRLTQFLRGPYDRASIRDVLEGMTVADISGYSYDEFMSAIAQKDRLVASRLWTSILAPVVGAWAAYQRLEPQRKEMARLQQAYQALVAQHTGCDQNICANNPPAVQR